MHTYTNAIDNSRTARSDKNTRPNICAETFNTTVTEYITLHHFSNFWLIFY